MNKNMVKFSIESFRSGNYSVVTRLGFPVDIKTTIGNKLYGFVHSPSTSYFNCQQENWNLDGSKYSGVENYHDLFLIEK